MHFDFLIPVLPYQGDIPFYDALATRLERTGATVGLISLSREGDQRLRAGHSHVFYLYENFDARAPADPREVARIEQRYRLDCIADHVYPEQKYFGGSAAEMATRAVFTFQFLERFLSQHSVSAFVNNVGGELIRRTMARLAEAAAGPKNIIYDFAPFHGRITLTTDETAWDDLPATLPALSAEQRAFIAGYVAEATQSRAMFSKPARLGIDLGSLYRPLRNIARVMLAGEQRDEQLAYVYRERVQHIARRAVSGRFYPQPRDGEPYLFFPLHVPFDSAITIRAPQFQNQENVIEYLAERALPTGHTLYVKPHPAGRDTYPLPMLARLRRMPGVRLIEPTVNSHRMIAGARAVVVINSTVGFESLLYGKPTVVLARVFYRGFGVTTDVEYLGDLRARVHQAINQEPDREAILRFLHACWLATSPGSFAKLDEDNLDNVCRALLDKSRRLGLRMGAAVAAG